MRSKSITVLRQITWQICGILWNANEKRVVKYLWYSNESGKAARREIYIVLTWVSWPPKDPCMRYVYPSALLPVVFKNEHFHYKLQIHFCPFLYAFKCPKKKKIHDCDCYQVLIEEKFPIFFLQKIDNRYKYEILSLHMTKLGTISFWYNWLVTILAITVCSLEK